MLKRLTRSLRRGGILVGVGTLALVAVLMPASPAQALPSGSGWSGSWNYYTSTSYQYQTTLPGVRLTGYGTDSSGTRTTLGTIEDTANDSRCARVLIYASGAGYIVDRTVCGSGTYVTYSTGSFTGSLLIGQHRVPLVLLHFDLVRVHGHPAGRETLRVRRASEPGPPVVAKLVGENHEYGRLRVRAGLGRRRWHDQRIGLWAGRKLHDVLDVRVHRLDPGRGVLEPLPHRDHPSAVLGAASSRVAELAAEPTSVFAHFALRRGRRHPRRHVCGWVLACPAGHAVVAISISLGDIGGRG
jgi:hypothetical protein